MRSTLLTDGVSGFSLQAQCRELSRTWSSSVTDILRAAIPCFHLPQAWQPPSCSLFPVVGLSSVLHLSGTRRYFSCPPGSSVLLHLAGEPALSLGKAVKSSMQKSQPPGDLVPENPAERF